MNHLFVLLFPLLFFSCQNEEKCQFKPEPILKKEWQKIKTHSFSKKETKAAEIVEFEDGNKLELFQEVCNNSLQEFQFFLKGDFKNQPDEFWIAKAIEQFYFLASLDKEAQIISTYGNFIRQDAHLLELGNEFVTEDGYKIFIDRIVGTNETKLIVRIS